MGNMRPNKLAERAIAQQKTVDAVVLDAITSAGTITGAARVLNVSPGTLHYHIKRMGLRIETHIATRLVKADG